MAIEIFPATDDDFQSFVPTLFGVMGAAGFVAALWPDNQSEVGQKRAIERWMKEKEVQPGIRWVKAVDASEREADGSPKIIGISQWRIFEPGNRYPEYPELVPEEHWPNQLEKEYALQLWESYIRPRRKIVKEATAPVINLQILCVWPQNWRKGAGGMLVKWGCDLADQIGAECNVESSGMGQPLYAKWGFELQEDVGLEADERFNDRKKGGIKFMVRQRARQSSTA